MSANYSMTLYQGTTFKRSFQIKEDSTILNITGYTFSAKLAQNYKGATVTSMTTAIEDAAAGTFSISLTNTQTDALAPGRYVYDVVMTSNSNVVTKLMHGYLQVEETL